MTRRENWSGDYRSNLDLMRAERDQARQERDEARLALGYARDRVKWLKCIAEQQQIELYTDEHGHQRTRMLTCDGCGRLRAERDRLAAVVDKLRGQRDGWAEEAHADWCCGPGEWCCCGHEEARRALAGGPDD